jgi:hypothetical protein
MKKIIFSLILLGFSVFLTAQTVDSIKVEQAGDMIKLHYKILNSNPDQTFRVTVTCSINGGLESIPKSLSGDFGDNVAGGRSGYLVLWDVLKDVDEIKSVDFSVRAELVKDYSANDNPETKPLSERRFHVFFVGGGPGAKFGGKIGYIGSWGITAMYLRGIEEFSGMGLSEQVFAMGLDLTKRIVNAKTFNMHLFAGLNVSKLLVHSEDVGNPAAFFSNCIGMEGGLIMSFKRLAFSFCINSFDEDWTKDGVNLSDTDKVYTYIGLGYRF